MLIAYNNPQEMAETLVTYMSNPREILKVVRAEFSETSLSERHIIEMRERHQRRVALMKRGAKVSYGEQGTKPDTLPKNVMTGTDALHRALWKEHPEILRKLGAVPCQ